MPEISPWCEILSRVGGTYRIPNEYRTIQVALTYAASMQCHVACHGSCIAESGTAIPVVAATVSGRLVLCAKNIVEADRAVRVPPEHLKNRAVAFG